MAAILGSDSGVARRRVHIVGCERSGTTLLLEMMTAAFRFDARCEREQSLFEPPPDRVGTFLSKKPLDILRLEAVFRQDPGLIVLCTDRDPRSVITSRHAGRPDGYLSTFSTWLSCAAAASRLEGHERFLRIRYERLVQEPARVQAEIAERFPFLVEIGSFARFHETATPTETGKKALGGVRPVDPSRLAGWRDDLPRVKAELLAHPDLPAVLIREGYEQEDAWVHELDGIEPHAGPRRSHTPRWLRQLDRSVRYWWKTRRYLARLRTPSAPE